MKFWIPVVVLCIAFLIVFFPVVNTERLCYEASQATVNQISENVINQRLSKEMLCSQRADALYALELCIRNATTSSTVGSRTNNTVQRLVAAVRMSGDNVWTLKEAHNKECTEFSSDQLP